MLGRLLPGGFGEAVQRDDGRDPARRGVARLDLSAPCEPESAAYAGIRGELEQCLREFACVAGMKIADRLGFRVDHTVQAYVPGLISAVQAGVFAADDVRHGKYLARHLR